MTLIVNVFSGPGAGKSTLSAGVFHFLKSKGYNVELATEFAKDLTWERRTDALGNQPYIFGKQYHKLHRLMGRVDAVITDSPILLSVLYAADRYPPSFKHFVVDMFRSMNNVNYYINRKKLYRTEGRSQTAEEAVEIDRDVRGLLYRYDINFADITGDDEGTRLVTDHVERLINASK